ncbi:MAG: hypothetical protein C0501_26755 [Isosphaera sp.]|nr:hypothetical protein [Isosphaera sp.]
MRTLVLLATAALLPAPGRAADPPARPVTKVFSVADLVGCELTVPTPRGTATVAADKTGWRLIDYVTGAVRPYSWGSMGGPGTAVFFNVGSALAVTNTPDAVQEVADLLEALRRLNAPAAEPPQASYEVRLLKVPAGFCGRFGLKAGDPALTEREARFLLEAAQGCRTASVMQAPKLTLADGEPATASVLDRMHLVTGADVVVVQGQPVLVPRNTPVDVGHTFTVAGRVAADGKSVEVSAKVTHTRVEGNVELVPVVTQITPVADDGKKGKPVPFTQYLQAADVRTHTAEGTAVVPSGGTAVLGTWTEPGDAPAAREVPYVGRLFKNPAPPPECEVVVLVTARVEAAAVAAPMPRPAADGAVRTAVYRLRHQAAADAVRAVNAFALSINWDVGVVAEPVSNSVLVRAVGRDLEHVLGMLAELDVRRPEVVVEALIVEAPATFLDDTGLTADVKGNVLTLTPRERKVFDAQLRKAKGRDEVEILARPQIQVADNQTGFVQVGQDLPFLNQGDAKAAEPVQYRPVGVTLRVTPRVTPDGKVLMRVEPTVSSVSPNQIDLGNGVLAPVFNSQTMQATVLAADGETAVVRGLGFRKGGDSREYLILLTPHVDKPGGGK